MSRISRRSGATAVEFALTLPVLVLTTGAVFDYGLFTYRQNTLAHALRDAVRIGIMGDPNVDSSDPKYPTKIANERLKQVLLEMGMNCDDDASSTFKNCSIESKIKSAESGDFEYLNTIVTMDYDPLVGLIPVPNDLVVSYSMALIMEVEGASEPPTCG